ncbi:MAG: hypothetical protein IKW24_01165, partial [Clostridia bacterium]|nr:hypothetical protein [Clostridia bacterium]
HGECVAVGMLCMSEGEARERIKQAISKFGLATEWQDGYDEFVAALAHDKKASGASINVVKVQKIGTFAEQKMTPQQIAEISREVITLV